MEKMVKIEVINGKVQYSFKLEDGTILVCGFNEAKNIMKKIDKGEIKILSMEV